MNINDFLQDKEVEIKMDEVVVVEPPEPTEEQLEQAYIMLLDIEHNNGYTAIAKKVGMTRGQVIELHRAMLQKATLAKNENNQ